MDRSKFKITLFFYRYFRQLLVTEQRRGMQQIRSRFFQVAFFFKVEPVAVAGKEPGLLLQAETIFLPVHRAEKDLLAPGKGRFLPLQANTFQNQIVLLFDGVVQEQKADDAAHPQEEAHGQQNGVFLRQGIDASKQDTEKADCTEGSQPGK